MLLTDLSIHVALLEMERKRVIAPVRVRERMDGNGEKEWGEAVKAKRGRRE